MQTIEQALAKLATSRFRASFKLTRKDREYVATCGMDVIRKHAMDFIRQRLAPATPPNDGKQTPYRGHPVFKAQHGTACCCRSCLNKWYKVPMNTELTIEQQSKIVNLIMAWISRQL